jgi:hypothetical protein
MFAGRPLRITNKLQAYLQRVLSKGVSTMSIAEFIELRESIEALAGQITILVKDKNVEDSQKHLEEANHKLDALKAMVATDVQVIVAERLTRQLTGLSEKVETMAAKNPSEKPPQEKKQRRKYPKKPRNKTVRR